MTTLTREKDTVVRKKFDSDNKLKYAQYFTPSVVAEFMAGMFVGTQEKQAMILDPGAGEGILGLSLAKRLASQGVKISSTFVEIDEQVFQSLEMNVSHTRHHGRIDLINGNFIEEGFKLLYQGHRYSHIVMNPPYFKLRRESEFSEHLMSCGVSVTNIYAAFMWLGLMLLADNGQMVAIVPRSFCNGPYFLKFREYVANSASIEAIHTFSSRNKVFSKDQVLQENIIIHFAKRPQSNTVAVTYSSDQSFTDILETTFSAGEVINKGNRDLTIRIPSYLATTKLGNYAEYSLNDLGLNVSTGPVVDFRQKDFIAQEGGSGSVPLLYPAHMKDAQVRWPLDSLQKKGQYYCPQQNPWNNVEASVGDTKNVSPTDGYYVVIRRFSSKEEKRRIYAAVVDPSIHPSGIAFENHLNYFHKNKHGFDRELAFGLAAYLNSPLIDEYYRTFSGHTQVNATDLRNLPYPSETQLKKIGGIALNAPAPIDTIVTEEVLRECA